MVRGLALPARRADFPALAARAERLAVALAAHLHGTAQATAPAPQAAQLVATVESAAQLALDVKLAEAADRLDRAIAMGLAGALLPEQASAFVTAHLARASIALARNEIELVTRLLDRVVRFDPSISLIGDEDRPRMAAALAAAKVRAQSDARLAAEDLAALCRPGEIVVVVRALDRAGASQRFEALRYDSCALVSRALGSEVEPVATALGSIDRSSPPARSKILWAPLGLGLGAIALAAVGAGLAGSAGADYASLKSTCGQSADCPPSAWQGAQLRERAGYSLIGLGVAAGLTSIVLWRVARRPARDTMSTIVKAGDAPAQNRQAINITN